MKKKMSLMLVLAMTASLFAACGSSAAEEEVATDEVAVVEEASADVEAEASADVAEGRTFTVGFDAEFPPYGYQDENGEYVGFDLDLAQEVCDRLGWTLVKQPINWDSKDMELNSGSIDCIWNGFTMNGREDDYCWSDAYVDNTQVVVVRADSGITSLADLAGKSVDVQADSSALYAIQDNEELASSLVLTEVADYNTAFMDLEAGATDAVAMDIAVANYQIESRGTDEYVILEEYISSEQYGIGFALGNEELRDQVQAVLYEMVEDGTFEEIAVKYGVEDLICLGN